MAGPDGKEHFRADCDGPVASVVPAADGTAALVQMNGGRDLALYSLYEASGKVSSLNVAGRFVAWVDGKPTALMETSVGHRRTWDVVDWRAGKRLLTIPGPNPARVTWGSVPLGVVKDYLLIGGLEYLSYDEDQKMPVRSIYTVGVADGRPVAHWLPDPKHQYAADAGRFLRLGQDLYFLTDESYCQVKPDEIAGRKRGWR